MITRFFGLPGCGKTTVAAKIAFDALRSGKFKNVYGNVPIAAPGYTYIPFSYVGVYTLEDCCIIIDEAAIECGNRDFKSFSKERVEFFMTHRHYRCAVYLFSQEPDGIDLKIRSITDRMYYIKKGWIMGRWFSTVYHIPYGLVWPDQNSNGENLGKIVMGYLKPSLIARLLAKRIYRPRYYHLFDSWETKKLLPLPTWENLPLVKSLAKAARANDKGFDADRDVVPVSTIPGSIARNPWFLDYLTRMRRLGYISKRARKAAAKERRALAREERRMMEDAPRQRLLAVGVYDVRREALDAKKCS